MLVAAGQLTATLDVEENRRRAVEVVEAAGRRGAALLVLPEATACTFGRASFDLSRVAEPLDGPFVTALGAAARRSGVTVVAGAFEPSGQARRVFNTTVVVGPDGLLGAYRKLHLFDALGRAESDRIVAGDPVADGVVAVEVKGFTVGVMTCYDLRFPEMARALVDRGATVLALPAHWFNGQGKAEAWEILVRARAIESTAYVVAAGKPEPGCVGRSTVVDPGGRVLGSLGGAEEGLVVAEVTVERLSEVRAALPVLEHRRFSVRPAGRG